jgi:hypothetical protein
MNERANRYIGIYIHSDLLHVSAKHVTIFREIKYKERRH